MTKDMRPSSRFRSQSIRILTAGFIGSFFSVGFSVYLFGVFQADIIADFGITVGQYSWAPGLSSIVSGVLSPIVGRSLVTRGRPGFSIRSVLLAGAASIGLGLILISRVDSIASLIAGFVLVVAPGTVMMGPLVGAAMVTNWFEAKRGRALGIVAAGTTVGGMLAPPLAAALVEAFGWRDAMAMLGILLFIVALPIVAFFATSSPEEIGESPDGIAKDDETAGSQGRIEGPDTTGQLLCNPQFWLVGVVFGFMFSAGAISVVFTVPYANQLGVPLVGGAFIVSLRAGAGAVGKILLGSLSDRLGVRPVLWGVIAVEILLTQQLIGTRDPTLFTVLGVGIGFVGGSALPLKNAIVGDIFGRASFASVMGLLQTLALPFTVGLVRLAGAIHDRTQDYAMVFGLTIPIFVLAGIVLFFVRPSARR
jgi:MFS family permease